MVDYLSEKCGLSTEEANNASKALIKIKSPKNPDSVLKFLKQSGFNDTHIKILICKYPRCLSFKVEKTLKPKVIFFQELGFSGADFAKLASTNPRLLLLCVDKHFRPSIDFLRNLLGTDDRIARAIRRWSKLLSCDYVKVIVPSVEAFRRCGFRDHHISYVVLQRPTLLFHGPNWIEELAARAEATGFRRGSPMLVYAILAMGNLSRTSFKKKLKLFKSFGWTEEEILSAFRRAPNFLLASERKIRAVMGFLMDEIGCKPSEIASRPMLFMFSFEKRLVPRYEVLKILKSRDLLRFEVQLWSAVTITERLFLKTYVMKYLDKAPDLREAYIGRVGSELSSAARALLCY
ncbi:Mitochodrial transcription termination factor-related [Cinnamomum micranthum f. kanehirae]|uniref:Mitochodrial transcription termination factor-related n=1 Tax=Cinnamomum micranthum f. kanehirae TaxID=337451 RepID=A0A3S4PP48_9MAGN|nr:Mitochodrial transcription termination factor-related [Cinnamomum micranthum f. kanehirae]